MAACVRALRASRSWKLFPCLSVSQPSERHFSSEETATPVPASSKNDESKMWHTKVKPLAGRSFIPLEYRYQYPEFISDKDPSMRHCVREKLERIDMLKRRRVIEIPEFYAGSILAVTASDKFAPGKLNRFVGICILRFGHALRAKFVLRNVVDHQGVEIGYDLYNPTIRKIEVLKLERRLDDELFYLRDALPEYSTFPFDMPLVPHPEGAPVPINPIKVKLKPRPWYAKWEQRDLKGVQDFQEHVPRPLKRFAEKNKKPWLKYDLMKEYRSTIPEEEQQEIYQELHAQEQQMSAIYKRERKRRRVQSPLTSN